MLIKPGLFLLLLTVLQVSARYKNVEPDLNKSVVEGESVAVSSSSSRIISGWEAQPGQIPYHAALRFVNTSGDLRQCGGSIVSKEWVITAATCTVTRILAVVRAGVVSLTNPEYIFETTEWYRHPDFNILTPTALQRNDIALVKLQRPVVYTRLLQPIRVQSSADAYRDYNGQQVFTSGHGNTGNSGPLSDVLRWVYLRAISNNQCARIYANGVYDTTICAQYFNVTSQATCSGDNGGPLVHVGSDGVPTLIGVSYFFSVTCDRNSPSGFTRTGPFLPWFQEVTGIDFENLQEDGEDVDNTSTSSTTTPITSTTAPITSTTDPSTTDPSTTDLSTTDSIISTPTPIPITSTTDLSTTDPSTNEPSTTEPSTTDSNISTPTPIPITSTTDLSTNEPSTTEPSTTDLSTTDSITSIPIPITSTTDPSTTDPSTSIPIPITSTTDPSTTDPSTNEPSTTEPSTTDLSTTDSIISTPTPIPITSTTDLSTTDPSTNEPSTTEPSTTDLSTTDSIISTPTPIPITSTTDLSTTDPSTTTTTTELCTSTPTPTTTTTDSGEPDDPDDSVETTTAPPNDSEEQEPDDVTPEDNTTAPPEDSEDKEDEEEDSDSSECNEDDEIAQLLKRLLVNVKVKVRFDKYNVTKAVGNEISVAKH